MEPTCTDTFIQTTAEAHQILYAVHLGRRQLVKRRPANEDERSMIRTGAVFVWEEGSGIERWTDRREWGDSRSREDFLFYQEGPKGSQKSSFSEPYLTGTAQWSSRPGHDPLIKQTYTALLQRPDGEKKWHLIAYYTDGTKDALNRVSADPELATLMVPEGFFRQARLPKSRRMRERGSSGAHRLAPPHSPPSPDSDDHSSSSPERTRRRTSRDAAAAALVPRQGLQMHMPFPVRHSRPPGWQVWVDRRFLPTPGLPKLLPARRTPMDEDLLRRIHAFSACA